MKRIVVALMICIVCIPMFSVMIPRASALVGAGAYTNPVPPGYGFINFEEGSDGQVIRSTLLGLKFTTTLGYDWVYGDVRTGAYNARSLTDPSVNYGQYVVNGYIFAWLGPNMGEGRIDFVNGPASYLSVLASTQSGLCIDAYDSKDNLIATSGWANGNYGTYTFTRLTVKAPNIAYVIIHDTGNYWLIDDLVTDAGGQPVYTCVQISSSSLFICETLGQSADIVATVSDQLGNAWPGVIVYFTASGGVLSATSAKTGNQGEVIVTLSPGALTTLFVATVTATANGVSNSLIIIFCPLPTTPQSPSDTNWNTNVKVFKIQSGSASLPNWLISTAKAYNNIPRVQKINIAKLENLRMSIYVITKQSSATQEEFALDLSSFFGITANRGYSPLAVLILEFPYEQIINALFDRNYHEQISIPLSIPPDQALLFDDTHLKSTPSGSFDFTITLSIPSGVDANQAIDSISTLADSVTLLVKKIAASKPLSVIQDAIKAAVGYVESIGDIDLGMITSDLDQLGRLSSYSILDLKTALDRFSAASCIVLKVLDIIVNGLEGIGGILGAETAVGLAVALWAAKGAIATILDLGLEIIDLTPWSESFRDIPLYRTLEGAIGWVATASDPERTIIIPSVFNLSGFLVLGYNSTSSDIIYASTEGILIPIAGDWLALLHEDKDNAMNYTIIINAVGGSAAVPYNLQILSSNQNVRGIGYCGMLLGGTSVTTQVDVAIDGTLVQQVYLDPALSVSETGDIYDFIAMGLLSNGSQALVTNAFLIFNGSRYEMTQDNSSTFEIHTAVNFLGNVSYSVYMISPNVLGGYASGVLTRYDVTFNKTGIESNFTGTVLTIGGSNYAASDLPISFTWDNGSTHAFAFLSPLLIDSGAKEYDWTSTAGLSTLQSDSITVIGSGNVTGNYVTHVHDVAVTSVVAVVPHCSSKVGNDSWVFQGRPVYVNVTVLNKGDFDENVNVTVYYNATANEIVGTQIVALSARMNQTITFTWNTKGVPYCLNYTITAVASIPLDNDPTDNTPGCEPITVRIMGDINGDGKVDGKDIVAVAMSFPSWGPDFSCPGSPPGPRWNVDCDINCDNRIDGKDLVLTAMNFGK